MNATSPRSSTQPQTAEAVECRVIVCGSRTWTDRELIGGYMEGLADYEAATGHTVTVVHGDARGADRIAAEEARRVGLRVEAHPADWRRYGKRAGLIRNEHMLSLGATRVVAFWDGYSRGTEHMIRVAREAEQQVRVVRSLDATTRPETTKGTHDG